MPIYEFECEDETCKSQVETLCPMGTEELECPDCGKPMKKLTSVANWSLKGDGWYNTTNPAPTCSEPSG